jgi:DNA-binding response OmpR family regulator
MGMKKKIIFIEDEEDLRNAVKFILESENYEFYGASNGPEGIAKITKYNIDLMLLDIMMPGMDGFEVCRAIKSEPAIDLPVVFVSAKTEATDIARGFALGADDYIIKPFDPNDLVIRIKKVFEKYEEKNRNNQSS